MSCGYWFTMIIFFVNKYLSFKTIACDIICRLFKEGIMSQSFNRKMQTLKSIGFNTNKKGVKQIHSELVGEGFNIDIRTLQRDINSLSKSFDIDNDGNKDQPGWFWKKNADTLSFPGMQPSVAVTFKLVEAYLKQTFPPETLKNLKRYFVEADSYLQNNPSNKLANWENKVSIVSRSQPFINPVVNEDILITVYESLLEEKQIIAHYNSKDGGPSNYDINPLGIVIVDGVIYLLCTLWNYTDIRQLALHRFVTADKSKVDAIPSQHFNLKEYSNKGGFLFPLEEEEELIKLVLLVPDWVADHLEERALSEDQIITEHENNTNRKFKVTATVLNTAQLRWWISHYHALVEVLEPQSLREQFKKQAKALHNLYS